MYLLIYIHHTNCVGLQAITSLLLSTTLRPHMGDPTSSIPMNIHRINEMLFLGSRYVRMYVHTYNVAETLLLSDLVAS